MLAAASVHFIVLLLQALDFEVVQVLLPGVGPALPLSIPHFWARLGLAVLHSGDVDLAIDTHIHFRVTEEKLVRVAESHEKLLGENWLEIETVLESEDFLLSVGEGLALGDVDHSPFVLVGPRGNIAQNLRLADPTVTPEKETRISSLKLRKRDSSNVLGSPQAIA